MEIKISIDKSSLHDSDIEVIAASIAQQVINTDESACVKYAMFRAIEKAASKAMTPCVKGTATKAAEEEHKKQNCEGAEVYIEGLCFQVKHTPKYNFSHVKGWAAAVRKVEAKLKEVKALKAEVDAIEEKAKLKLNPVSNEVSISFQPK